VLAAPYHRLSDGIIAAHAAFALPPDAARDVLVRRKVAYVVTCGPRPPLDLAQANRSASLWGQLQAGAVPGWLDPVAETSAGPFRAYRVRAQQ
jgi:hypothetical protein